MLVRAMFAALCLLAATKLQAAAADSLITLTGIIEAIEWDEDGEIIQLVLTVSEQTDDEEAEPVTVQYMLVMDNKGFELTAFEGQNIEISGTLHSDNDGVLWLTVLSHKLEDG